MANINQIKNNALSLLLLFFLLSTYSSCSSSPKEPVTAEEAQEQDPDDGNSDDDPPLTGSFVQEHGQLRITGNKIVDKNNEPVQLRGMSFFWSQWIGKYYTKEVVAWLKNDWQVSVVRASMAVNEDGGYVPNPEQEKQKIFTVIDAAIEEGIYVVVDWHSHHAEDYLAEAKVFFSEVAERYGDTPNILYEPYNEPLEDVSWVNVIKPYCEEVISAIREHDSDNIVVCGTSSWSQRVNQVIGNTIADDNVAYTLHYYAASHKQELRDIAQQALDNDIALFVTEFGVTEYTGDGFIDTEEANIWWKFLDDNKISWCNWSVADKVESAAILVPGASTTGGWNETDLTTAGQLVRGEIRNKNPNYGN